MTTDSYIFLSIIGVIIFLCGVGCAVAYAKIWRTALADIRQKRSEEFWNDAYSQGYRAGVIAQKKIGLKP